VLMRRGDFAGADHKLAAALGVSTEEQKIEIKAVKTAVDGGVSCVESIHERQIRSYIRSAALVRCCCGKRDYDSGTRSYVANHWLTFFFCPISPRGL
jgi:hypothetical protein